MIDLIAAYHPLHLYKNSATEGNYNSSLKHKWIGHVAFFTKKPDEQVQECGWYLWQFKFWQNNSK